MLLAGLFKHTYYMLTLEAIYFKYTFVYLTMYILILYLMYTHTYVAT